MTYSSHFPIIYDINQGKQLNDYIRKNLNGTLFMSYNQGVNDIYFLPNLNSVLRVDAKQNLKGQFNKLEVRIMSEEKNTLLNILNELKEITSD